jgi:hypothetical protein
MMSVANLVPVDWHTANQRYLVAALDRVRAAIERHLDGSDTEEIGVESEWSLNWPPALEILCAAFDL